MLAEPEVRGADRVVLTGDIAAGPQPVQVLDLLTGLGDRVVWISGNADRELVEYRRGLRDSISDPIAPWAAEQLRDDHLGFLGALSRSLSLSVRGLGKVLFCHATPVTMKRSSWSTPASTVGRRSSAVSIPTSAPWSAATPTCMPFVRLAHGRLVVNPGSVGMPYGRAGAHWAVLGPGVDLRTTTFDVEAAAIRVGHDSAYPGIAEWADHFPHARATDEDALEAFGPRDGRTPVA